MKLIIRLERRKLELAELHVDLPVATSESMVEDFGEDFIRYIDGLRQEPERNEFKHKWQVDPDSLIDPVEWDLDDETHSIYEIDDVE